MVDSLIWVDKKSNGSFTSIQFDGPGMAPFARDIDNFWYKLSRIILTDATPSLYIRRLRWANEIETDLISIGIDRNLSAKRYYIFATVYL